VTLPDIRIVGLSTEGDGVPYLLGPSLGTLVARVWGGTWPLIAGSHPIYGWDLPGHGISPAATSGFSVDEIAEGVLRAADAIGLEKFAVAGISLGGLVSLAIGLRAPERVLVTTMVCSLPRLGTAESWAERAAAVRASGTPSLVQGSATRWFAPGFIEKKPDIASPLLNDLMDVDDESYALCAEALGAADLRARVGELAMPLVMVAGELDPIFPVAEAKEAAASARDGRFSKISGAAHLAPAEKPEAVAAVMLWEVPL
jgi:3-oxoadipate enol-lactonase